MKIPRYHESELVVLGWQCEVRCAMVQFELSDTVQFYCPNPACKGAITYRQLDELFKSEPKAWDAGDFSCPHCKVRLTRKVIRHFESGGYQWIPEYTGNPIH